MLMSTYTINSELLYLGKHCFYNEITKSDVIFSQVAAGRVFSLIGSALRSRLIVWYNLWIQFILF